MLASYPLLQVVKFNSLRCLLVGSLQMMDYSQCSEALKQKQANKQSSNNSEDVFHSALKIFYENLVATGSKVDFLTICI